MRNRGLFLVLLLMWALLGAGCSEMAARKLQVVTTFSILQDFVQQVGGDAVSVQALVPLGADPHTWGPTPREAAQVTRADLVVANGAGFDDWLLPVVKNAARGVPVLVLTEGLELLAGHEHDSEEHNRDHHDHTADPHLWLSVPNAVAYVERIKDALIGIDPSQEEYFTERAQEYIQQLWDLDQRLLSELGTIPPQQKVIITYHNAFSYLAERYGFTVAEFLVDNPEAEPNPRELGRLVGLLKGLERPAVFTEPQLSTGARYLQALAQEAGAQVYTLFSDSLTAQAPTYIQMMEHNLKVLLEALR